MCHNGSANILLVSCQICVFAAYRFPIILVLGFVWLSISRWRWRDTQKNGTQSEKKNRQGKHSINYIFSLRLFFVIIQSSIQIICEVQQHTRALARLFLSKIF